MTPEKPRPEGECKAAVGEPGYLPYCGNCTALVRMKRGTKALWCPICKMETRIVNGEDMFDRTAPLATAAQLGTSDANMRERCARVANKIGGWCKDALWREACEEVERHILTDDLEPRS